MRSRNSGSMAMTSAKVPCLSHVFFMTILPSSSRISRLDLAGLAVDELAQVGACRRGWRSRVSFTQRGQSESVSRGQPSCGKVRSRRLSSGAGAHVGLRRRALELGVVQLDQRPRGARGTRCELLDVANEIHRLFLSPPTRVASKQRAWLKCAKRRGTSISWLHRRVHAGPTAPKTSCHIETLERARKCAAPGAPAHERGVEQRRR